MEQTAKVSMIVIFLSIISMKAIGMITYNVVELGADPMGEKKSTIDFESAWRKACNSEQKAIIHVPEGSYLVDEIKFKGPCKNGDITMQIDGVLVAPPDYHAIGDAKYWIKVEKVDGFSIVGGVIDAQGASLWDCKRSVQHCPRGATSLAILDSNNINIQGLNSKDSQLYHIVVEKCNNVRVEGVGVAAPEHSPNTDGIHVQECNNVAILDTRIGTGDDCISIGPGAKNLWIENVNCGPGHGISIGSLGKSSEEEGVMNVTARSVSFSNSKNGFRIKTWGRPSSSFVQNVFFQNALMDNVKYPIIIDQNYCPGHKGCPGQESGVKISEVSYEQIHGSSATEIAVKFDCSRRHACRNLSLKDIDLKYKGIQEATSRCASAYGEASGVEEPKSCLQAEKREVS